MNQSKSKYKRVTSGVAKGRIHFAAPAIVVGALFTGALLAVGHHLFYASLQGQPVQGNNDVTLLGSSISKQQINITAGTIFAFLVNFCLGTALTTAYAQVFWQKLLYLKATLGLWDTAFSATSNVFFLGKVWVWWKLPTLAFFAITAWLIPFAVTFPPGTLNVGIKPVHPAPTLVQHVPIVDFTSLNYVAGMPHFQALEDSTENSKYAYNGPSSIVQRIASQVAQTGSISPIRGPPLNASYTIHFDGPALACNSAPESLQTSIKQHVTNKVGDWCIAGNPGVYGYTAWKNGATATGLGGNVSSSFRSLNNGGMALNLVAFPHMMDLTPSQGGGLGAVVYPKVCSMNPADMKQDAEKFAGATMLQCQLRNVTYHVQFNYTNGEQSIGISTETISTDPLAFRQYVSGDGQAYPDDVHGGVDCTVLAGFFMDGVDPERKCQVDTKVLRHLSYQAIFDAFAYLLHGSVVRALSTDIPDVQTDIESTVMIDTPELSFLNPYSLEAYPGLHTKPLQAYIQVGNLDLFQGLVNNVGVGGLPTLPRTIETLFQNITVSMMSDRSLRPNKTSAYVPDPVEVTLHHVIPVYEYSPSRLWLSYGVAIGCAVLVACFGLGAIIINEASYSTDFSTIFRISRALTMNEKVKPEDTLGKDPLPDYLKNAKVWLDPATAPAYEAEIELKHTLRIDESVQALTPTTVERTAGQAQQGG